MFKIGLYLFSSTSQTINALLKTVFRTMLGQNRDEVQFGAELCGYVCHLLPPASKSRMAQYRHIKEDSEVEKSFPGV